MNPDFHPTFEKRFLDYRTAMEAQKRMEANLPFNDLVEFPFLSDGSKNPKYDAAKYSLGLIFFPQRFN